MLSHKHWPPFRPGGDPLDPPFYLEQATTTLTTYFLDLFLAWLTGTASCLDFSVGFRQAHSILHSVSLGSFCGDSPAPHLL